MHHIGAPPASFPRQLPCADLEPHEDCQVALLPATSLVRLSCLTAGVRQGFGGWWWGDRLLCSSPLSFSRSVAPGTCMWPGEWRASGVAGSGFHSRILSEDSVSLHALAVSGRTLLPSDGEEKGLFWTLSSSYTQDGSAVRGLVSYLTGHRDTLQIPGQSWEMSCLPVFWGQSRLLLLGL